MLLTQEKNNYLMDSDYNYPSGIYTKDYLVDENSSEIIKSKSVGKKS